MRKSHLALTITPLAVVLTSCLIASPALANEPVPNTEDTAVVMTVVDTQKPVATLQAAPSIFNSNNVDFVITAVDETALTKVVGNIRNSAGTIVKPAQAAASGTSGELVIDLSSLTDGTYTLRYNALDSSGNVAPTQDFTFTVDNTLPTVTIKADSIGGDGTFRKVGFKLYDAGKIDKVELNGVVKDLSNNTWSDLNGVTTGVFGGVEGLNTLKVFDVAGNASVIQFTLDTTGPTATVKPEGTIGTEGVYQKVSYKLFDASKVVKAIINGVEKPLTPNQWSDLNDITPGTFGAVEGVNTLVLEDALGNQSTQTFTIDTTKPVVNVPAAGQWVSGTHTWNITQVEANPARAYVEIQQMVDGKWKKYAGTEFLGTNVFDATFDTTVLADNVQTQIKISTKDKAGNQSGATFAVKIDNSAPKITVKPESIGNGTVFSDLDLKLYDGLSGVDKIFVNGVEKDQTNNAWSDLNDIKPGKFGAVEGENTIVLQDVAGNTTTLVVTLDATTPTVTTKMHEWQTKDGGRDSITLTFSEAVSGLGQGWYGSGTTWTKVFYNTKPATVAFVDAAGNKGSYTLTPNAAPVVTPPTPEDTASTPETSQPSETSQPAGNSQTENSTASTKLEGTLPATGLSSLTQFLAGGGLAALLAGLLAKLKSIFG